MDLCKPAQPQGAVVPPTAKVEWLQLENALRPRGPQSVMTWAFVMTMYT